MENIASLWDLTNLPETKGPYLHIENPEEQQDITPFIDSDISTVDIQKVPEILQDYLPKGTVLANYQQLFKTCYNELVKHIKPSKVSYKCDMKPDFNKVKFRVALGGGFNFIKNLTLTIETMDHNKIPDNVEVVIMFGSCIKSKQMCRTGTTKDGKVSIDLNALITVDRIKSDKLMRSCMKFIQNNVNDTNREEYGDDVLDTFLDAIHETIHYKSMLMDCYIEIILHISSEYRYVADLDIYYSTLNPEIRKILQEAPILTTDFAGAPRAIDDLVQTQHLEKRMPILTQENLELINNLK